MSKSSDRVYNCSILPGDLVKTIHRDRVGVVLKVDVQRRETEVLWADDDVGSVPKANLIKIKGAV